MQYRSFRRRASAELWVLAAMCVISGSNAQSHLSGCKKLVSINHIQMTVQHCKPSLWPFPLISMTLHV